VRRLTYNPDFEAMVEDLLAFLADPAKGTSLGRGQANP
jgi:hypothetical protein